MLVKFGPQMGLPHADMSWPTSTPSISDPTGPSSSSSELTHFHGEFCHFQSHGALFLRFPNVIPTQIKEETSSCMDHP